VHRPELQVSGLPVLGWLMHPAMAALPAHLRRPADQSALAKQRAVA
jgi:hypothetical protein